MKTHRIAKNGISAEISTLGATLLSLSVDGKEMLMRYKDSSDYSTNKYFVGSVVAPNAGRLKDAKLVIDGSLIQLPPNENQNSLHSGEASTHLEEFEILELSESKIKLGFHHNSMRGGYPADIDFSVSYELNYDESKKQTFLEVIMSAIPSEKTHINMTHHAYFNLGEQSIHPLSLKLNASEYLEVDHENIPSGLCKVDGTRFDFREDKQVSKALPEGVDNPFILSGAGAKDSLFLGATLESKDITLDFFTNQPAVVMYTNHHQFQTCEGLCLEFQKQPNTMNIIKPGEVYENILNIYFSKRFQ